MATAFTGAKYRLGTAEVDLPTAISGATLTALLVMSNFVIATEQDATFIGDISDLDEFDGVPPVAGLELHYAKTLLPVLPVLQRPTHDVNTAFHAGDEPVDPA